MLQLSSYIEYIQNDPKPRSPATIENYQKAIKYTEIKEIETDNLDDTFRTLLNKLQNETPYGYINNILSLIRSTLELHGYEEPKGIHYKTLLQRLNACGSKPEAYSESEIKLILNNCQEDLDVFKTVILCTYSGLRIGGCESVNLSGFRKMTNGIYIYKVVSKGKTYLAAISEYGYNWLLRFPTSNNEQVIAFSPEMKSDFADIYRKRLIYIMMKKGISHLLRGKQPYHGFRKFFSEELNKSKLEPDEISLLMGHTPNTTAYKYYITDIETGGPRLAEVYAKTTLNQLRVLS